MKKIYLANPLGFSEINRIGLEHIVTLLKKYFSVHEPFGSTPTQILDLLDQYKDSVTHLRALNREIGKLNFAAIDECDIIIAILDGPDVDSGVAVEMGYAYAKGKTVYGLNTDFRMRGDNKGDVINIQVMSAIHESGGIVFSSINELIMWLKFVSDE